MYRLLVADDEMIERAVLVQLLEEELGDQCRIFQAENGREALEVYEKEKIQIDVPLSPVAFPLPSHLLFDGKKSMEEAFRIPSPFHFGSTVEEFRLVRHPVRFRSKKGRYLEHPDAVLLHQVQGPAYILFFISQVAPQGHIGYRHARIASSIRISRTFSFTSWTRTIWAPA